MDKPEAGPANCNVAIVINGGTNPVICERCGKFGVTGCLFYDAVRPAEGITRFQLKREVIAKQTADAKAMSYANYPPTIGELRSQLDRAANWKPRDALINMLRAIDAGEIEPDMLVIAYRNPKGGGYQLGYSHSSNDQYALIGLLTKLVDEVVQAGKETVD